MRFFFIAIYRIIIENLAKINMQIKGNCGVFVTYCFNTLEFYCWMTDILVYQFSFETVFVQNFPSSEIKYLIEIFRIQIYHINLLIHIKYNISWCCSEYHFTLTSDIVLFDCANKTTLYSSHVKNRYQSIKALTHTHKHTIDKRLFGIYLIVFSSITY